MSLGHGASIVRDGLVFSYDMGNSQKSWKGAPTTNLVLPNITDWTGNALVTLSNEISPIGTPVYTVTDDSSTSYLSISPGNTVVPNNTETYTISIYIKKTFGATSARLGFNCGFNTGGTTVATNPRFNSDTGVGNVGISNDLGNWWRWSFQITNNGSGNTNLYCSFFPATGLHNSSDNVIGIGTATVSSIMIEQNTFATPFVNGARSNIQAILDLTKNNTITATSLTYENNGLFSFASSSNYISVPYNPQLDLINDVTLDAWVKYTSSTNTVCIEKSNNNTHYQFQIFSSTQGSGLGGELVFMLQPNSSNWVVAGMASNDGNWHNVVGTYNRSTSTAKIYIDGVLRNTNSSISVGPSTNTQPLLIGSRSGASGFGGSISNVKIYNKVLSATEITRNFNSLRGRYGI
jgi:hypothetical protein